jgi:hypothetical protein
MVTPDPKPNPADPLSNPPAVPEVTRPDLPLPDGLLLEPDELPPLTEPDHPLGPHYVIDHK